MKSGKKKSKSSLQMLISLAILCLYLTVFAKIAEGARPNIIVILADDMGYGDPGCYNAESKIPTPNMDRLAEEGVRFTDAHSPSAVCTPSRYGLLTGRYCYRSPLQTPVSWPGDASIIEEDRLTIGSVLNNQGYATACVGKWHLGMNWQKNGNTILWDQPITLGPRQLGFEYYYGIEASLDMDPYFYIENDLVIQAPTETIEGNLKRDGYRGGKIAPDFKHDEVLDSITVHAISFIHQQAQTPDNPFFLFFSLASPHLPWLPTGDAVGASESGKYGDFVYMTDQKIGMILDTLDSLGLTGNTLVIMTSDNGARNDGGENGHKTNGDLKGQKGDIWEAGHRIPFIARWPERIEAGAVSDEMICLTDMLATFAHLAGEPLPEDAGEDSYNILPALLSEPFESPIREATVIQAWNGNYGLRMGDWYLSTFRGSGGFLTSPRVYTPMEGEPEGELYNLAIDPEQENNVYLDHPDLVDSMNAILERYKTEPRSTIWNGGSTATRGGHANKDFFAARKAALAGDRKIYSLQGRLIGAAKTSSRPPHGIFIMSNTPEGTIRVFPSGVLKQ